MLQAQSHGHSACCAAVHLLCALMVAHAEPTIDHPGLGSMSQHATMHHRLGRLVDGLQCLSWLGS
jgi:hypothetical protein